MITANELRIGNLIFWNPKLLNPNTTLPAMQVEVFSISKDKIGYVSPDTEYRVEPFEDDLLQTETRYKSLEELEPIILTSEILEKCGFKGVNDNLSRNVYYKKVDEYFSGMEINIIDYKVSLHFANGQRVALPHNCKSLNQLQNLYFALTDEEL